MKILAILILLLSINIINVFAQNVDLERGKKLFQEDELSEAIKAFDSCLKKEKVSKVISDCLQFRAVSHARNGNQQQADRDILVALKLTPKNPDVYFNRGRISYSREDLNKALIDFNRAISIDPKNAEAFYLRGIIYSESNQIQKSINDFTSVIKLNPSKVYAYSFRGDLYLDLKKYDLAIADLTRFIELSDDKAGGYLTRAVAYQKSGNKVKAKADYEKALKIEPDSDSAKDGLNNLNLTITEVEMWVDELLRTENGYSAIEFLDNYPEFAKEVHLTFLRAQSYLSVGDTKEADKIYKKLLSESLVSGDKNFALAERDFAQNKFESALDLYKKSLEYYEDAADTNRIRNNVYKFYNIGNEYKNPKQISGYLQSVAKYQQTANKIAEIHLKKGETEK